MPGVSVGTSLLLITAGAILKWAISAHVSGVNINTVGLIVFAVGLAGLAISLAVIAMSFDRTRPPDAPPYAPPRDPDRTRPLR